jgi:hypothetical protein
MGYPAPEMPAGLLRPLSDLFASDLALARNQLAFRFGTFLPFLRAFDKPIAMACLRLLTLPPLPPGPLRALPRL